MSWINVNSYSRIFCKPFVRIPLGILLVLLLIEAVLRIVLPSLLPNDFGYAKKTAIMRPDPVFAEVYIPGNLVSGIPIDAYGFKNRDIRATYDVIALGDGMTEGVENSWPAMLAAASGRSVYNMGVHGYGPAQYQALATTALKFHPKDVVVLLNLGNDIFNAYDIVYHQDAWKSWRTDDFIDSAPAAASDIKKFSVPFQGLRDAIREHWYGYRLLGNSTRYLRERVGVSKARMAGTADWAKADSDVSYIYDRDKRIATKFWLGMHLRTIDQDDKNMMEGLRLTEMLLGNLGSSLRKQGARLTVVILPTKPAAYEPLLSEEERNNTLYHSVVENDKNIRKHLAKYCTEKKMSCTDALPEIHNALARGEQIYPEGWDDHLSDGGYRLVADIAQKAIEQIIPVQ